MPEFRGCLAPCLGPNGHESTQPRVYPGLPWEICFTAFCPHKALLRCAFEKNTRRARVGAAEGAPGCRSVMCHLFLPPLHQGDC